MQSKKIMSLTAAIYMLAATTAFAANITCQLNPATGKIEASQAWKNVLGDEADRACEKAMPSANKQQTLVVKQSHVAQASSMPQLGQTAQAPIANSAQTAVISNRVVADTPTVVSTSQVQTRASANAWQVELKDVNLSNTFSRWAELAGWRIRWDADKNILVDAPDVFNGSFEDAVTSVLSSDGIQGSTYPLEVCFYSNTPPLARITRKGEQKDCK